MEKGVKFTMENKQNTENKNTTDDKTVTGAATSAKPAKEENPATNRSNNPTNSSIGKDAPQSGSPGAAETLSNVKDTVGAAASEAVGQAKEKAGSVLDEQKTNLASGITSVADSIRQVGENFSNSNENNQVAALAGKYGDTLAQQVEKFSSYIDEKEIKELVRDVEQFAKRNPLLFVGSAFTLGILAARFLKSSSNKSAGRRMRNSHSDN